MYNLRYHVASLAAVFLALAVGLLLGTAIADRSTLDAGQQQLIQSVQDDVARQRASSQALTRQLEAVKVLEAEAASRFSEGLLAGERILLIAEGPGLPSGARDLVDRVKAAGGRVQILALRRSGLGLEDARVREEVRAALGETSDDTATLAAAVNRELPGEVIRPGGGPVLEALAKSGAISLEPGSLMAASGIVLFYGGGDPAAPELSALARRFSELDVDTVAVERSDTEPSAVPEWKAIRVTSVDNVDRPIGQLSTILVLAGSGVQGHFGSKDTATAPMPPLGNNGR